MFSTAIYSELVQAEFFIKKYSLSGRLIKMPLNVSLYELAVANEYIVPDKECHHDSNYIEQFTTLYSEHHDYLNGNKISLGGE